MTTFEFDKAAGGDPLALDDDESREAFEFLQELEPYLATEYKDTRFDTANELLIDDQVYLVDNWTFGIKVVVEDAGRKEIKAYSGWSGPGGEAHVLGGDVLAVPKGASHSDKAIELIRLLVSKETQQRLLSDLRWMPIRLDAYDGVPTELAPYFSAVTDAMARAEARPTEPQWTLRETLLDGAFGRMIRDDDDIDPWLRVYCERLAEVPAEFDRHISQPGDTPESVADQFDADEDILRQANRMAPGTSISPGTVVLVPRVEGETSCALPAVRQVTPLAEQ